MPRSRLGRLFTYSKDSLALAQENFTTEALRMAIEDDPAPMLVALSNVEGCPPWLTPACSVRDVSSQVSLPRGFLDLVIDVDATGGPSQVWVEVKVDAAESGDQLAYYQKEIAASGAPIWLVTLAKEPVRATVPFLSWTALYLHARHGRDNPASWIQHEAWKDFGLFLEEYSVASDALAPITDTEAGALGPASLLITKVAEVVRAVHRDLPDGFPAAWRWRGDGSLMNYVGAAFRSSGDIGGVNGPIWYGMIAEDGTAYWQVAIDTSRNQYGRAATEKVREVVAQASLPDHWRKSPSGSIVAFTRTRAASLPDHDAAKEFLLGRIEEVWRTGVLDAMTSTPVGAAADAANGGQG